MNQCEPVMRAATPEVVYALPDKMGGVHSFVRSLLTHRQPDGFAYAAALTRNLADPSTPSDDPLTAADRVVRFPYRLPSENLRSVLRRLAGAIGHRPGVIVANDWIELAMAAVHDTGRAVIAITHGDFEFYYRLATRHDETIDAYVTYSTRMRDRLLELLPHRRDDIYLLKYGVAVPAEGRRPVEGPLRAIYAGRLSRDKGIFDLPAIADELRRRGRHVVWTIQGTGPDEQELKQRWPDVTTRWTGLQPMDAVLAGYRDQDVLVMPSRNEGLPVALLEAGAAGVVPVVSNLASGIPEIVRPGETGYRPEPGDIAAFAAAVMAIDGDRASLERMSVAVRGHVSRHYDARVCTAAYQQVYAEVMQRRRPWRTRPLPYGSRLDRPWIPNRLVQWVRAGRNPSMVRR